MARGIVLQANGEPYRAEPRGLTRPVDTDLPASERRTVSQTVSPAWLRSIEERANKGQPRDLINFADVAREKDDRIGSCAGRRERAVARLDWSVQPGTLGPDATDLMHDRAAEIAHTATGVLERIRYYPIADSGLGIGVGGFSDRVVNNNTSTYYGIAPLQWEWDYVDGRWDPVRAFWFHPRRFVWDEHLRPRLYDPGTQGPAGMYPGMELEPLRWTIDLGQVRPGYPMRDGYARAAVWLYAYKAFSWKDFVQYSEQFGTPFLLGYVNGGPNASDATDPTRDADRQQALWDVIKRFAGLKRAVIDGADDIKPLEIGSKAKHIAPVELIHLVNDALAILFLGATQAVDVGDTGTYASSKVHENVELHLVQQDAEHRSNAISEFIRNWFSLNFDDGPEFCPRFWLDADEPADLKSDLEIHRGLYDMGVELSKADLREHYGVDSPLEGEDGETDPDDVLKKTAPPDPFSVPDGTAGMGAMNKTCVCPECGYEQEGEAATPCTSLTCPECGAKMVRKSESASVPRAPAILAAKPPDEFDEDEAGETYEGSIGEYVNLADDAAAAARSAAIETAEDWIASQSADPGLYRFAEEMSAALGPEYANVIGRAKFRPVIEAIYGRFKLDENGWPKGVSFNFGPEDIVFKEQLAGLNNTIMSQYITNSGAQAQMKGFLREFYGERGADLFKGRMKKETIQAFKTELGSNLQSIHDWQAQRIINTETVRIRSYAEVQQFVDANVFSVQWYATSLERCERCKALHGTKASVTKIHEHMQREADLEPDAWVEVISGKPSIDPEADAETLRAYLEQYGIQPPAHPNCKCMLLYAG